MKKLSRYAIPIFLVIFLVSSAYGFAGMTKSNSIAQLDPNNITESDQDIVLRQHLIEVDSIQLQSQNKLYVSETLTFKNTGNMNFSGKLRTWVPDGAEIIRRNESGEIEKRDMITGTPLGYRPLVQNGNIISWQDDIEANALASLYVIEYLVPAEPKGTLAKAEYYSKKLNYPTLINYKYEGKGLYTLILKVIKSEESSVTLHDEKRNRISPDDVKEEGNSVINRFLSPQFKELNIEISNTAIASSGIASYVVLGIVIILVISYPLIRKKSGKIQAIEEKIRNSFKREKIDEEYEEAGETGAEGTEEPEEKMEIEPALVEELEGKTRDELESMKAEILSKLDELDKEYASGNLLDEEYEELRKSYREKAGRIAEMLG